MSMIPELRSGRQTFLGDTGKVTAPRRKEATDEDLRLTTRGRAIERSLSSRATVRKRIGVFQQIKSAAVKGLLIATVVGAAIGIDAYTSRELSHAQPAKPAQLQVALHEPSQAAKDAARISNAKLDTLPEKTRLAQTELLHKLDPSKPNLWRDTKPFNTDGTVNGYVEISLGSRDKYELDVETNKLELDRVIHESVGGYPINYGIIPATFSWDGDPFDVVVLGPKIENGTALKGKIVGIYHMVDEKGFDPHLVISPVDEKGNALFQLDTAKKAEIASFVERYKKPDAHKGKWAKFVGWGDAADGLRFTKTTSGFFDAATKR
jgi:inorganic pyrophosphatase